MDKTLIVIWLAGATLLFGAYQQWKKGREGREVLASVAEPKARSGSTRCSAENLRLKWPLGGVNGRDWVIANYVDHDPDPNRLRDYLGATAENAVTYDGHAGLDIEIASFRVMDQDVPVLASADGTVEETFDASPDRNLRCSTEPWNFVRVRHAGGYSTLYGHLKRGSVAVAKGQRVQAGMKLGSVGSSGCSTYPHLHLEVQDCQGKPVDPMLTSLFQSLPVYARQQPPSLMEAMVFQPTIDSILPVQDPGTSDANLISVQHTFSVGVTVANLKAGDTLRIDLVNPSGVPSSQIFERSVSQFLPRSHWWGNFQFDTQGTWTLVVRVNGRAIAERQVSAVP